MNIEKILINNKSIEFIKTRKLEKQYIKAKKFILKWYLKQVDFKLREPKKDLIYYFRINKQYRAWCRVENNILKVFYIDDHS